MSKLPTWVYTYVILAVVTIGLGLNVFDAASDSYEVPDAFNAIVWVVAGAALGQRVFKKQRGDNDE